MKKVKSVAFNVADPIEYALYQYALENKYFSTYVKRLIQRDMEHGKKIDLEKYQEGFKHYQELDEKEEEEVKPAQETKEEIKQEEPPVEKAKEPFYKGFQNFPSKKDKHQKRS